MAFRMTPLYVGDPGQVERAYGLLVSGNYFSALGLEPALGRFFHADEVTRPGGDPVVGDLARLLAVTLRRRAHRRRPDASRERPRADDRRRRAARLPGHGSAAEVRPVAAGDDGAGAPQRIARARRCAAPAGTPPRAGCAQAQRRRRRRDDVDLAMQQLSRQLPGDERHDARRGAAVLAIRHAARSASWRRARVPAGHHAAAADRGLREHREPDAGARQRAAAGDGHAPRARRRPLADCPGCCSSRTCCWRSPAPASASRLASGARARSARSL